MDDPLPLDFSRFPLSMTLSAGDLKDRDLHQCVWSSCLALLKTRTTYWAFRDRGLADNCSYWSLSQVTADMAHHIDFADAGRQHYDDKDFPRRVRAIRAF